MRLTPEERETIILFSDADTEANVYTHDVKLIARLKKLAKQYPDKVYEERKEHEGAVSYMIPKNCVCLLAPYDKARREAARNRALQRGSTPPKRGYQSHS